MKRLLWASPVVALVSLIALAPSASAAYGKVWERHITVSCDRAYTTDIVWLPASGTTSFGQYTATSPNILLSEVWATSANGNDLPHKNMGNGGSQQWTSVAAAQYLWRTRPVYTVNCSSIAPGAGNADLSYIIRY
jgi:hypothetical protein